MLQLQQAQGQPVDTSRLAQLMEEIRPRSGGTPLPDWYVVAECMRLYHWTERMFWEENSPAMIFRMLWLERIHAEREEKDRKRQQHGLGSQDAGGYVPVAQSRPRRAPARR